MASFVDFDWGVLLQPWSKYRDRPADTTIFATAYEDPKHMKVCLLPRKTSARLAFKQMQFIFVKLLITILTAFSPAE